MEPRLGDKLKVLINDISIAMRRLEYALYRGMFIKTVKVPPTPQVRCEGVWEQSNANESFKARMLRGMKKSYRYPG